MIENFSFFILNCNLFFFIDQSIKWKQNCHYNQEKKNSKEKTKTWIWNKNSLAHWIHIAQTRWTWCFALKKICCASNNLFLFLFIFLWIRQFLSLVLNLDFHLVGWFSYFILGCVCVCDDLKSRKKNENRRKKNDECS